MHKRRLFYIILKGEVVLFVENPTYIAPVNPVEEQEIDKKVDQEVQAIANPLEYAEAKYYKLKKTKIMKTGESFGERALIENKPR